MKYEQYFSLIRRLEKEADQNPKSYKYRVTALAFLGYAYFLLIAFVPVAVIALIAVSFWFYPGFLLVALKLLGKLIWLLAIMAVGFSALRQRASLGLFTQGAQTPAWL